MHQKQNWQIPSRTGKDEIESFWSKLGFRIYIEFSFVFLLISGRVQNIFTSFPLFFLLPLSDLSKCTACTNTWYMQCILRCPICNYRSADGRSENLGVHVHNIITRYFKGTGATSIFARNWGCTCNPSAPQFRRPCLWRYRNTYI